MKTTPFIEPVDWTKPIEASNGDAAEVVTTIDHVTLGTMYVCKMTRSGGKSWVNLFFPSGHHKTIRNLYPSNNIHIRNKPEPTIVRWVNFWEHYAGEVAVVHDTERSARAEIEGDNDEYRLLASKRIEFKKGEID